MRTPPQPERIEPPTVAERKGVGLGAFEKASCLFLKPMLAAIAQLTLSADYPLLFGSPVVDE